MADASRFKFSGSSEYRGTLPRHVHQSPGFVGSRGLLICPKRSATSGRGPMAQLVRSFCPLAEDVRRTSGNNCCQYRNAGKTRLPSAESYSNKLLVLVDRCTVYTPFFLRRLQGPSAGGDYLTRSTCSNSSSTGVARPKIDTDTFTRPRSKSSSSTTPLKLANGPSRTLTASPIS